MPAPSRPASELGVKIIYKGPLHEDDRAGQISLVEQFASDNVNGIVLAPLDNTALLPSVQSAMQKKTPVVIIDSSLKGDVGKDFVCYVGTNNAAAGKMGGEELARILGGKGKYVLLRYAEGSASTDAARSGLSQTPCRRTPGWSARWRRKLRREPASSRPRQLL